MVAPGTLRWGPGEPTLWNGPHGANNRTDNASALAMNASRAIDGDVAEEDLAYTVLVANWTDVVLEAWPGLNATNSTWNVTNTTDADPSPATVSETVAMAVTSVVLGVIILATVIGNVFVIAAILLERHLQNVANYLILSLAVADLMVACLVMPLGAVYEVSRQWILGPELCDMWTSSDVLCCTASILHLVAIAVDRYWAVTNVDYIHHRNSQRIGLMILAVWVVSFVVSLAPIFGWKDSEFQERVNVHKRCLVSQDIAYQVFATLATFYVPLIIILVLYWRIYQTARKRIRRKVGTAPPQPSVSTCEAAPAPNMTVVNTKLNSRTTHHHHQQPPTSSVSEATTAFTTTSSGESGGGPSNVSPEKSSSANGSTSQTSHMSDMSRMEMLPKKERKGGRESAESKRERKAAKTLAIITGAFVFCWFPFFVLALVLSVCGEACFNNYAVSFFLWLGYLNSTLNPIIYTIFSPEFRSAFKRILFGRRRRGRYRPKR